MTEPIQSDALKAEISITASLLHIAIGQLTDLASYNRCRNHADFNGTWEELQQTLGQVLSAEYHCRHLESN
jgi:hypothetical protein